MLAADNINISGFIVVAQHLGDAASRALLTEGIANHFNVRELFGGVRNLLLVLGQLQFKEQSIVEGGGPKLTVIGFFDAGQD